MYDIELFYEAKSVQDAVDALVRIPDAIIISGGSDVLVQVREGRLAGAKLVSIHNIPELKGVHMEEDGTIVIGAATPFSQITADPVIQKHMYMLGEAADTVGGPQIRNIGTVGGNVCNGVTSADTASSQWAYNSVLELIGPEGVRQVPVSEFYTGPGKTVRRRDEVLTAFRIRREDYEGYYGHYMKYGKRRAMEIATLGCACLVKLSEDKKTLEDLRIAYGVAAPTPMRCRKAEDALRGRSLCLETVQELGRLVQEEVTPRDSWRASKAFRLQLVKELGMRALAEASVRAGGDRVYQIGGGADA